MGKKTGSINHIHKYFRRDDGLWACYGLDGCTHYMPRNMAPLPSGLLSVCWGDCGNPFRLTPYNMQDARPMCDKCTEGRDVMSSIIEELEAKAPKPTGMAAFAANGISATERLMKLAQIRAKEAEKQAEKDQIEVIEPDDIEVHDDDCEVYLGMACTCKFHP